MEPTRLFDFIYYQQKNFPQKICITGEKGGKWVDYSTDQIIAEAEAVSKGLLQLGIQPGDKVATITKDNCPEWNICDIAISQIGAVNVPVYPTISENEYNYIFDHAEVKVCIVSNEALLTKVRNLVGKVATLTNIFSFNPIDGCESLEDLKKKGASVDKSEIQKRMDGVKPNELATLIYTSGTTGLPKGVMLSHDNIVSNVKIVTGSIPIEKGQVALSFLPLCHIFERMVTYCYVYAGVNIWYSDIDTLGEKLQSVKPHFFTAVPRLLEKVYEKIVSKGQALTGLKKKLFFWALDLADKYEYDKKPGIQEMIADKLIFSKWREALGGRVIGVVSGSAPLSLKIARVFSAAGVQIREGYGLTETSPVLTFGRFDEGGGLLGTVGSVIDGVEIKLADDGEILAKGPNIMLGYYKAPDLTAEVMTPDGWFCTGDIGVWVKHPKTGKNFLKITDRKKQLLKTSGGKYVAPAPIENKLKESFFIEQVMVVGEGKKFVSALIVPAFPALQEWAKENGISFSNNEEIVKNEKVLAHYKEIINGYNPEFNHVEQIKKFKLLQNEWTVDTEELTPTMKVKRKVISDKFSKEIEELYN